jgi:hypothetical protein
VEKRPLNTTIITRSRSGEIGMTTAAECHMLGGGLFLAAMPLKRAAFRMS